MVLKTGKKATKAPEKGAKKQVKSLDKKATTSTVVSSKKNSIKSETSSLENKLDIFQDCEVRNGRIFLKKGNDFANFPDLLSLQKR